MTDLDFSFQREFTGVMPDAYQRLLLDAMNGDASLFARSDEVELAWGIIDPILAAWNSPAAPPLEIYEPNLWGPDSCDRWMRRPRPRMVRRLPGAALIGNPTRQRGTRRATGLNDCPSSGCSAIREKGVQGSTSQEWIAFPRWRVGITMPAQNDKYLTPLVPV